MHACKTIKRFLRKGIQNPSRMTDSYYYYFIRTYTYTMRISASRAFAIYDVWPTGSYFNIQYRAGMPLWCMKLHADSVPCLSNRIMTAAAARIVVIILRVIIIFPRVRRFVQSLRLYAHNCTRWTAAAAAAATITGHQTYYTTYGQRD